MHGNAEFAEAASVATLERTTEGSVTFVDTADMDGSGPNGEPIGSLPRGHRHRVVLDTRFGVVRADQSGSGLGEYAVRSVRRR